MNSPKQTKVKKIKVLTKKNIFTNHELIDKLNYAMDGLNQKYFSANTMSQMKWRLYLNTQTNISLSFT